jgi:hypothetical protein
MPDPKVNTSTRNSFPKVNTSTRNSFPNLMSFRPPDVNTSTRNSFPNLMSFNPKVNTSTGKPDVNTSTGNSFMDKIPGGMGTMTGAAVGAVAGVVGGLMDNSDIRSGNQAINNSINSMQNVLADLKKQRTDLSNSRASEATSFLTQYVTARDPNRSNGIAQMYQQGQNNFRDSMASNDAQVNAANSQISALNSQKQTEKEWWEIGLGSLGSAAASALPMMLMG